MTDKNFEVIRTIAYKKTGISLSDNKKNMVYGRLARRLRSLNLSCFDDYCDLISDGSSSELPNFINAITTNLTSFFRERHHFDYLSSHVFPTLSDLNSGRLRIWSAGCSTGEEPYSISMVMNEFPVFENWNAKILATDLDTNVIAQCKKGEYSLEKIDGISTAYNKHFITEKKSGLAIVKDNIKKNVHFKHLNLMGDWPMKGPFDVIFCRNVVIYFDLETQSRLFSRFADLLTDSGLLFVGHSESLHNVCDRFHLLGKTIYKKVR